MTQAEETRAKFDYLASEIWDIRGKLQTLRSEARLACAIKAIGSILIDFPSANTGGVQ